MKGKKKPAVNSGFYETPKDTDRAAKLFELPLSLTKGNPPKRIAACSRNL